MTKDTRLKIVAAQGAMVVNVTRGNYVEGKERDIHDYFGKYRLESGEYVTIQYSGSAPDVQFHLGNRTDRTFSANNPGIGCPWVEYTQIDGYAKHTTMSEGDSISDYFVDYNPVTQFTVWRHDDTDTKNFEIHVFA